MKHFFIQKFFLPYRQAYHQVQFLLQNESQLCKITAFIFLIGLPISLWITSFFPPFLGGIIFAILLFTSSAFGMLLAHQGWDLNDERPGAWRNIKSDPALQRALILGAVWAALNGFLVLNIVNIDMLNIILVFGILIAQVFFLNHLRHFLDPFGSDLRPYTQTLRFTLILIMPGLISCIAAIELLHVSVPAGIWLGSLGWFMISVLPVLKLPK